MIIYLLNNIFKNIIFHPFTFNIAVNKVKQDFPRLSFISQTEANYVKIEDNGFYSRMFMM